MGVGTLEARFRRSKFIYLCSQRRRNVVCFRLVYPPPARWSRQCRFMSESIRYGTRVLAVVDVETWRRSLCWNLVHDQVHDVNAWKNSVTSLASDLFDLPLGSRRSRSNLSLPRSYISSMSTRRKPLRTSAALNSAMRTSRTSDASQRGDGNVPPEVYPGSLKYSPMPSSFVLAILYLTCM